MIKITFLFTFFIYLLWKKLHVNTADSKTMKIMFSCQDLYLVHWNLNFYTT